MATVKDTFATIADFTITLASLGNSTTGVGRQSTLIDNTSNLYESALVSVMFTVGTTPTANTPILVYLIRSDNNGTPIADDGAGTSDAALTIKNANLIGTIINPAATSNTAYSGVFDTVSLGSLGPRWGIAIVNSTGVTANSTAGNFKASFIGKFKTVV